MASPAAFVARAREVLARATDRAAHGFPSPLPWYVSGERPMIWADDGDALVSIGARDETPYIEPPVAALAVLAVNSLAALLDVVEAADALLIETERDVPPSLGACAHLRAALARLEVPE